MKTSVEKLSETRVKLTVNVPFDELSTEIDQAYAAIAQQVTIPGFRQGKAPRQLIDARFGRGPILEQVINDMLPSRYQRAVEETETKAIGQPDVDISKIEDKDFVEFTAEVDIRPDIEVPNFEEFAVTVPVLENGDDAVDAKIDELRARFAELKDSDAKLKKDHFAVIDLEVEVDGEKIDSLSTEGLSYQVGTGDLMAGLDEALEGLKSGEDNEFTSELIGGEHAGKEAKVKVTVKQTKKRKLPKLDDEFVQEASEFDTVDELKEDTRNQVEGQAKAEQAAAIRDEVLKKALEASTFELPQSVVDEQVHSQLHQVLGQMAHDDKALAQLLEIQGKTREEFDNEMREQAEQSVRTQLFLDAVADEVEPEVTQEELTDHILFTAQSYGMDPTQFISQLQQADQIGNLFADVRRGKALASVITQVDVTDEDGNKVDVNEYFGEEESEEDSEEVDS